MRDLLILAAQQLRPFRRQIALVTFVAVAAAGVNLLAPILLGRSFALAEQHQSIGIVLLAIVGWFLLLRLGSAAMWFVDYYTARFCQQIALTQELEQVTRLLDMPLSIHYDSRSQETAAKLASFRSRFSDFLQAIIDFLTRLLSIIIVLSYLYWLDWRIASVLAIVTIVAYVFTRYSIKPFTDASEEFHRAEADLEQVAWDGLKNALVVKSCGAENNWRERLRGQMGKTIRDYRRMMLTHNSRFYYIDTIVSLGALGAIAIAVTSYAAGSMSLAHLTTVTAVSLTYGGHLWTVIWQFKTAFAAAADWKLVREKIAPDTEDFVSGEKRTILGDIEFRDVSFNYDAGRQILTDVSFRVASGQTIALVGESGVGKTTIIDLIGRYYRPQAGEILIDGRPAESINLRALREQMAYVPQDLSLLHDTLKANILYGKPSATDETLAEAINEAGLRDFIAALPNGLDTVVGERGLKLSGGERQRVALARAFLRDARILIFDEPTSQLDSRTEEVVQRALAQLKVGRTTFIVAHRLRTVRDADLIVVLKEGRVVETGAHAELLTRGGAYAELHQCQVGAAGV